MRSQVELPGPAAARTWVAARDGGRLAPVPPGSCAVGVDAGDLALLAGYVAAARRDRGTVVSAAVAAAWYRLLAAVVGHCGTVVGGAGRAAR